ncbi:MAG: ATPase, T2SS/T4P/T4SS family [Planctomycetota bacterium]
MKVSELRGAQRFTPKEGRVCIMQGRTPLPEGMDREFNVLNVSTSGLCFNLPFRLHTGDALTLSFKAFHLAQPLMLLGEVAWCLPLDPGFNVGICFKSLKPQERIRLQNLPGCVDLKRVQIDPDLCRHVPAALALRRQIVPFACSDEMLHVAMADPNDMAALEALKRNAKRPIKIYHAERDEVIASARMLYARDAAGPSGEDDRQAVTFLDNLIRGALIRRASDIHLEPQPPSKARFRVDGRLVPGPSIGLNLYPALVSRIKVLSGLDIAERREAQDGRMTWKSQNLEDLDMRVATIPTVHGEHVTLRLLGGRHGPKSLEDLGMLPHHLQTFREAIAIPYGMILLTGPTGCGKSTTLYAALETIRSPEIHILSVEDPVERRITGISQVQVDHADKVGFDSALRSMLRHDPDVIMIGEIRDSLSLDVAMKSALTGHLVFSSLHTNDASSAPARLMHMGAPPYLAAATLSLVVAQRLVRRLCPECKRPGELDARIARFLDLEPGLPIRTPGGCMSCGGTGYSGRMGVFEFLVVSDRIREMIVEGASAGRIREAALEEKMTTLRADGADKVVQGLTDPAEIMRAVAGTIEIKGRGE